MSLRHFVIRLLPALLLGALFANQLHAREIPYQPFPLKIQILSSRFTPADASARFPKDCDLKHFSEACADGKTPAGKAVMRVEDDWGRKFTLTCAADASWSHCAPLPVKARYRARHHSNGLTIAYRDASGKRVGHFYLYSGASAPQRRHPRTRAAEAMSPAPAPVASPSVAEIRCRFTSNPAGAEIQIDGHYYGNTPSEIALTAGAHRIVLSMAGYVTWKRELTVTAGSKVNVLANLQK